MPPLRGLRRRVRVTLCHPYPMTLGTGFFLGCLFSGSSSSLIEPSLDNVLHLADTASLH